MKKFQMSSTDRDIPSAFYEIPYSETVINNDPLNFVVYYHREFFIGSRKPASFRWSLITIGLDKGISDHIIEKVRRRVELDFNHNCTFHHDQHISLGSILKNEIKKIPFQLDHSETHKVFSVVMAAQKVMLQFVYARNIGPQALLAKIKKMIKLSIAVANFLSELGTAPIDFLSSFGAQSINPVYKARDLIVWPEEQSVLELSRFLSLYYENKDLFDSFKKVNPKTLMSSREFPKWLNYFLMTLKLKDFRFKLKSFSFGVLPGKSSISFKIAGVVEFEVSLDRMKKDTLLDTELRALTFFIFFLKASGQDGDFMSFVTKKSLDVS